MYHCIYDDHEGRRNAASGLQDGGKWVKEDIFYGFLAGLSAHGVSGWKDERQVHGKAETLLGR